MGNIEAITSYQFRIVYGTQLFTFIFVHIQMPIRSSLCIARHILLTFVK